MGVKWASQRGAGSSHCWLLQEGKEQAGGESGSVRILGRGNGWCKGPEAGTPLLFKGKQGGECGRSGKEGGWLEGKDFGYQAKGSRKPSEDSGPKSTFDLEGDVLKVLTAPCTEFSKHHPLNFYLVTQHLQTYIAIKALRCHPSSY